MDSNEQAALAAIIIATFTEDNERKKRRNRNTWVKSWFQKRNSHEFHSQIVRKLRLEKKEIYENYLRIAPGNFEELLEYIKKDILKGGTHLRKPILHEIKVALTIRFLASGNSYQDFSVCFHVHKATVAKFISEVWQSIYARLKDTHLKVHNFYY